MPWVNPEDQQLDSRKRERARSLMNEKQARIDQLERKMAALQDALRGLVEEFDHTTLHADRYGSYRKAYALLMGADHAE